MRVPNQPELPARETSWNARFRDSRDFAEEKFALRWLIERILVNNQPFVIGGPIKCLKTGFAIDLALSLGSGSPFLGQFPVPHVARVALMSAESGAATVQDTANRICRQKNIALRNCDVLWAFQLPRLASEADLAQLEDHFYEEKVKVAIFDPLYLCLLSGNSAVSASNLYEMGPLLRKLGQVCLAAGTTPVFVHHATKSVAQNKGQPLTLEGLAFAGIGEYARQWLLLSRRQPYQEGTGRHRLYMVAGGSAGHTGCWEVDVDEGVQGSDFGGRKWQVRIQQSSLADRKTRKDGYWDYK